MTFWSEMTQLLVIKYALKHFCSNFTKNKGVFNLEFIRFIAKK